jgi:hypothetical protein
MSSPKDTTSTKKVTEHNSNIKGENNQNNCKETVKGNENAITNQNPIAASMLYARVSNLFLHGKNFDAYVGHSIKSLEYYMQKETDWDEPVVETVILSIMQNDSKECQYVAKAVNHIQLKIIVSMMRSTNKRLPNTQWRMPWCMRIIFGEQ